LSEALTGWRCSVRVLEHRQLPLHATIVEAQNVQVSVVALNLEVAIVWSIPLIDGFDNFDLTSIEPKAHRHFDPEMADAVLNLYLHGCPLLPAAVIGGMVIFGSNTSTLKQTVTNIKAAEARRAELIGRMDLRVVGGGEVES
jgi:hypothetical protein